ncbi:helix-turn-helix domain-containing protein [Streptomyces laurentii]|uniref:helix-turn-helix domain-containing protein n=1 Tax=Streptomyces laurentii TaxID=39478 RepID=UPI0033FE9BDE
MANKNELNPDASPQAAYGARLRRTREEQGLSQVELGVQVGYSGPHISQVENGRKLPSLKFSKRVDIALGTGDAFERAWREMRQASLLEGFPEYVEHEGRAAELRLFDIGLIPGLLQTPGYARCLADSKVRRGVMSPDQAEELVAFLEERQAALVRPNPPTVMIVLDESCIRKRVGGPGVMGAQLDRLLEFAEQPNHQLQIATFDIGERHTLYLPVYLLTLPDMTVLAYAESQARGHLEREPLAVWPLLTSYHQLQAEALPHKASVAMIEEVRKDYL